MNSAKNIDQKFDYKALMSCISNTLKREEETLDPSFFDALMDFDGVDFLNNMSNEDIQANVETINTTKILNQLIRTNSSASSEITNEQIDLLLKSSNLITDSDSRRTSVDKRIRRKKRYLYEDENSITQDTLDSNDYEEDEEDDDGEDEEDENSNQLTVKRKTRSNNKNGKKMLKTGSRTSKRKNSTDSSNGVFKKDSNKEAATRYRIKKMSEKDQLFETKVHLEKQNYDTQKKIDHVQTEINYLKNLLCQVLLTKGILS